MLKSFVVVGSTIVEAESQGEAKEIAQHADLHWTARSTAKRAGIALTTGATTAAFVAGCLVPVSPWNN